MPPVTTASSSVVVKEQAPMFRGTRNMMVSRMLNNSATAQPAETSTIHELRESLTMPGTTTSLSRTSSGGYVDDAVYDDDDSASVTAENTTTSPGEKNHHHHPSSSSSVNGGGGAGMGISASSQNTTASPPGAPRYQYKKVPAPPRRTNSRTGSAATTITSSTTTAQQQQQTTTTTTHPAYAYGMSGGLIKNQPTSSSQQNNSNSINNNSWGLRPTPIKMSSDASIMSSKSTKSVRTVRSIFRRKKSSEDSDAGDDNMSVTSMKSTKSRGWWNRNANNNNNGGNNTTSQLPSTMEEDDEKEKSPKSKKKFPILKSFRFKKKSAKRSGRSTTNDQLVADFFDVQSLASEPDFVGSSRLKKAALNGETRSQHMLETRSVSSSRSARPSFFAALFLRNRAINDEVADLYDDDPPDLAGTGIKYEGDFVDDDEDVTLGSAFENISLMDSLQDDDESVESGRFKNNNMPAGEPTQEETLFLHRILQKRSLKKEDTNLHKVVPNHHHNTTTTTVPPESSSYDYDSDEDAPKRGPPARRDKALIQGNLQHSSSKSLGAVPASSSMDIRTGLESTSDDPQQRLRGPDGGALCRWDSDRSLGSSQPQAPKRPSRRSHDDGIVSPQPTKNTTTPVNNTKSAMKHQIPKSSQSMRNLKGSSSSESRNRSFSDEDDDDSVLSLLSGLLASWSDERDGLNNGIPPLSRSHMEPASNAWSPRGILKTSRDTSRGGGGGGEQKEESREQYSVVFDKIEIREYERVVGDNPSCSRGPPISIGWAYMVSMQYRFDEYEASIRRPKRSKKEFHLGADKRTHLLVNEWECSEEDIRKARREATYIQYCRAKTSFSGSRAAAKEAAFLRKANDRSKQMIMNHNNGKKSSSAMMMPSSEENNRPQRQQRPDADPKPVARRSSGYLEVPQPPPPQPHSPRKVQSLSSAELTTAGGSSTMQSPRHRPLVGA